MNTYCLHNNDHFYFYYVLKIKKNKTTQYFKIKMSFHLSRGIVAADTPWDPKVITAAEARERLLERQNRYRTLVQKKCIPTIMEKIRFATTHGINFINYVLPFNLKSHETRRERDLMVKALISILNEYKYQATPFPNQFDKIHISFQPIQFIQVPVAPPPVIDMEFDPFYQDPKNPDIDLFKKALNKKI